MKSKLILKKHSFLTYLILNDFEYEERFLISKLLKKNGHFFDIGANIGLYSILATESIENGTVYAFEPSSVLAKEIEQNIILNKLTNIKIFDYAVSDKDNNFERFFLNSNGYDVFNSIKNPITDNYEMGIVKTIRLDTFIKTQNLKIQDIQFIKIDVEGMEYEVMQGADNLLKNGQHVIFMIEFNQDYRLNNTTCNNVYQLLKANNFECYYYIHEKRNLINIVYFPNCIIGNFFCFHLNNLHSIHNHLNKYNINMKN